MDLAQIQQRLEVIEKLQEDIKKAKSMIDDALNNDSVYTKAVEESKESLRKKKQAKDQIINLAENKQLMKQIKDDGDELLTLKEILSEELIEYRQKSKTESIQDKRGQTHYFKFLVKLSRNSNNKES